MSFLLTSRLGCRKLFSANNSVLWKRLYAAKKEKTRQIPAGCIQHIYQRPYETHDDKNRRLKRPLTPCLSIYAIQICSVCSITHRMTGVVGAGYLVLLATYAIWAPNDFNYLCQYIECMRLPYILIAMFKFGVAFPYIYHSINGLRHLTWDTGRFLDMGTINSTGVVVMCLAALTTGGLILAM